MLFLAFLAVLGSIGCSLYAFYSGLVKKQGGAVILTWGLAGMVLAKLTDVLLTLSAR